MESYKKENLSECIHCGMFRTELFSANVRIFRETVSVTCTCNWLLKQIQSSCMLSKSLCIILDKPNEILQSELAFDDANYDVYTRLNYE